MTFYISGKCIQCGSCAPFCKNEAIDWVDKHYEINPNHCDRCGVCLEYCPIDDAILTADWPKLTIHWL